MSPDRSENQTAQLALQGTIELKSPSGRIILQQFTPSDAKDIFDLINRNRAHLSQHGDQTAQKYQTVSDVLKSIAHPTNPSKLRFAIRTADGILVGSINLTPDSDNPHRGEVGYYLGAEGTGQGYATEAVKTLCAYAFETLGYEELYAKVVHANGPSARVLLRAGWRTSGVRKSAQTAQSEMVFTMG